VNISLHKEKKQIFIMNDDGFIIIHAMVLWLLLLITHTHFPSAFYCNFQSSDDFIGLLIVTLER